MTEEAFRAWAMRAAADRDAAIAQIKPGVDAVLKAQIIERLRADLNCL